MPAAYKSVLLPGVMAISMVLAGVQAVAMPLITEFQFTREIEDRPPAPIEIGWLAVEKIVAGMIQAMVAGTGGDSGRVAHHGVRCQTRFQPAIGVPAGGPLVALFSSAGGLALGCSVGHAEIGLMFSLVLAPMMMFGCADHPWSALNSFPVLQVAVLVNPLVYASEATARGAGTAGAPHQCDDRDRRAGGDRYRAAVCGSKKLHQKAVSQPGHYGFLSRASTSLRRRTGPSGFRDCAADDHRRFEFHGAGLHDHLVRQKDVAFFAIIATTISDWISPMALLEVIDSSHQQVRCLVEPPVLGLPVFGVSTTLSLAIHRLDSYVRGLEQIPPVQVGIEFCLQQSLGLFIAFLDAVADGGDSRPHRR